MLYFSGNKLLLMIMKLVLCKLRDKRGGIHILFILMFTLMLTSCATLINKQTTFVHIKTDIPSVIIYKGDSLKTSKNRVLLTVNRSKCPLILTTITDSITREISILSKNSVAYTFNILNFGIGMLFEKERPIRYEYPWRVKLTLLDSPINTYRNIMPYSKGNLLLYFSFPYKNNFYLQPQNENSKNNTGNLGISLGLDIYYKENSFLNISVGSIHDFYLPFPAPIDYFGVHQFLSSKYLIFSNNHVINKFSLGYGVSYCKNEWVIKDFDDNNISKPSIEYKNKSHKTLGLVFSTYYRLGKTFNLGLIYRPTFLPLNINDSFRYEHSISIDLAWKFKLI